MAVYDFQSLSQHVGHKIVCVTYGKPSEPPVNVAIECEDCNEVLLDYDNENFTENGNGNTEPVSRYKVITYCDFGESGRRTVIGHHLTTQTAERALPRYIRIYSKLHGWKVWQEEAK